MFFTKVSVTIKETCSHKANCKETSRRLHTKITKKNQLSHTGPNWDRTGIFIENIFIVCVSCVQYTLVGDFNPTKDETFGHCHIDISQMSTHPIRASFKNQRLHFCEIVQKENRRRFHPRAKKSVSHRKSLENFLLKENRFYNPPVPRGLPKGRKKPEKTGLVDEDNEEDSDGSSKLNIDPVHKYGRSNVWTSTRFLQTVSKTFSLLFLQRKTQTQLWFSKWYIFGFRFTFTRTWLTLKRTYRQPP